MEVQDVLQVLRVGEIGPEQLAVQPAVEAPQQGFLRRNPFFYGNQGNQSEIRPRDLVEGLDHPARLQPRVGEDADAQPPRLGRGNRLGYSRQTRIPSLRNSSASTTDLRSMRQPLRTIFESSWGFLNSKNFLCGTARISASATGSSSQDFSFTPYSSSASSAATIGSCTKVSTPNSASSRRMSATFELRMSETFSLKVRPSTLTRAPLMLRPAWIICWMALRATCAPMPSLMRRPARITSGW